MKHLMFFMWLSALVVNVWAWQSVDWFFDRGRKPRAILMRVKGSVKARPQDLTLWRFVQPGRYLYGDEILATENDSTAFLKFQGGKSLELGPNSQLGLGSSLDEGDEDDNGAMVITLLKGSAKVETQKKSKDDEKGFEVKSGDAAVKLDGTQKTVIELTKNVKKSVAEIIITTGEAQLVDTKTGKVKNINKKTNSKPKKVVPKIIIGSLPRLSVAWPQNNMTLWTTQLLSDRRGHLPIRIQSVGGSPQAWEAFVLFGSKSYPVENGQAKIPINFLKNASATTLGYRIKVQVGARFVKPLYQTKSGKKEIVSKQSVSFEIRSLKALPAQVRIFIPNIRSESIMASGWFLQKGVSSRGLTVNIYSHADSVRMAPVLNAAKYFNILASPPPPRGKGMYLSRGGKVIASVENVKNLQDLRLLRSVLNADLVFYGMAQSLVPLRFDAQGLQTLRSIDQVYVASGGQMKPIRTEVLLSDPAARNFVMQSSDGVFLQPVQVMEGL